MGVRVLNGGPDGSIKRFDELDSLRGLAALSVVFDHYELIWSGNTASGLLPAQMNVMEILLRPFTSGYEAVILFFILSGFVLSIPAINCEAQSYLVFVIRRIFRIYLPYAAALGLAVLGSMFFYGDRIQSGGLGTSWNGSTDWHIAVQHLILVGHYNVDRFDPPIWSLVHEMRISLVFPFLCALVLRMRPGWSLFVAACMSGVSILAGFLMASGSAGAYGADTLHYAALFVVGIYLARQRKSISEVFHLFSRRRKIWIAVLSVLLFIYGGMLWREMMCIIFGHSLSGPGDWLTALGAAGIIVVSLNGEWCRRLLLRGPVHALGKMSYSIYLLHFIVLLAIGNLLHGKLSAPAIFATCLAVTGVASWLYYRCVETPSIKLGRRLSGYV